MGPDELLWRDAVEGRVSISLARIHIRTEPHFEMQVCQIGTLCCSYRADFITTLHLLPGPNSDHVQMGIHCLHHRTEFISLRQAMRDEDHFAPARPGTACVHYAPGSCRVNGIAQIGIPAANAVQIVTEMPLDTEWTSIVGEGTVF